MTVEEVKKEIRDIIDFPIKGIVFKDITTALLNPKCLEYFDDAIYDLYKDKGITQVIGIESRGFIMGGVAARRLNCGFVPIRKPGKLPANTIEVSYKKEYGIDTVQIHKDALSENDVVLIHDDLLATGGTLLAAVKLVQKCNVKKVYVNTLIELDFLKGREIFDKDTEITTLLHY